MATGESAESLNVGRIPPFHNSGSRKDVENYQSTSSLWFLKTVFKRLVRDRIFKFLKKSIYILITNMVS